MNIENKIIELEHTCTPPHPPHTHIHKDQMCLAVLKMDLRVSFLLDFPFSPKESDVVGQPSSPCNNFEDRAKDQSKGPLFLASLPNRI